MRMKIYDFLVDWQKTCVCVCVLRSKKNLKLLCWKTFFALNVKVSACSLTQERRENPKDDKWFLNLHNRAILKHVNIFLFLVSLYEFIPILFIWFFLRFFFFTGQNFHCEKQILRFPPQHLDHRFSSYLRKNSTMFSFAPHTRRMKNFWSRLSTVFAGKTKRWKS